MRSVTAPTANGGSMRPFFKDDEFNYLTEIALGAGDHDRFGTLWEKHRAAWDRFADLNVPQAERIEIPRPATGCRGRWRSSTASPPRSPIPALSTCPP